MLARKENNSTYKETSRVTYEEDFMLGFLPIREELESGNITLLIPRKKLHF